VLWIICFLPDWVCGRTVHEPSELDAKINLIGWFDASSFFGARVFDSFVDGQQVLQARYGYDGNGLGRQRCQTELLALITAADEEGDQGAHAGGIEKAHSVEIEDHALSGFCTKPGQEFVHGLNAQFSAGHVNREGFRAAREFFNIESKWRHKRLNLSESLLGQH